MTPYLAITVSHGYIPQILLAEAIFTLLMVRRSHFWLRLALSLILTLPLMVILPNWVSMYVSGLFSLTIFLLSLPVWVFCLNQHFKDILFCCVSGQLVQNLSYNLEQTLYQPFAARFSTIGSLALSISCTVLVYGLTCLILVRMAHQRQVVQVEDTYVYAFALITAVFVYFMQYQYQINSIDRYWVAHLPLILCCTAGLCVQYGFVALKTENNERVMLERLMQQETKQYELSKENIDIINLKAHDLKHQIQRIQAGLTKSDQELVEIGSLLDQYDRNPHTGDKELDLIISQKEIVCRRDEIVLSVMVQPGSLSGLKPGEVASIFGNLLDNAIEYERSVEETSKRYIGVKVHMADGVTGIRIENYCLQPPTMAGGLPVSTKRNRNNHGFGLRSVEYTVGKYKGTMHLGMEEDLFVVSLIL